MFSTLLNFLSYLIIREIFKHLEADVLISFSMRKQVSKANNLPPAVMELSSISGLTSQLTYVPCIWLSLAIHYSRRLLVPGPHKDRHICQMFAVLFKIFSSAR